MTLKKKENRFKPINHVMFLIIIRIITSGKRTDGV